MYEHNIHPRKVYETRLYECVHLTARAACDFPRRSERYVVRVRPPSQLGIKRNFESNKLKPFAVSNLNRQGSICACRADFATVKYCGFSIQLGVLTVTFLESNR